MKIEWNEVFGFAAGIAGAYLGLALHKAYLKIVSLTVNVAVLEQAIAAIGSHVSRLEATVEMYDKACVDNDKAANSIAKSAVQMQEMLTEIKAIMMPPVPQEEAVPTSLFSMQNSFESIQKDLIVQGIDPETAKYKAAEYELDRLAEGDLSEISMSL